jgi:hypothetical protein
MENFFVLKIFHFLKCYRLGIFYSPEDSILQFLILIYTLFIGNNAYIINIIISFISYILEIKIIKPMIVSQSSNYIGKNADHRKKKLNKLSLIIFA